MIKIKDYKFLFFFKKKYYFLTCFFIFFLCSTSLCSEFYQVDRPSRKKLNEEYKFDIDIYDSLEKKIDLSTIDKVFIKNQNLLLAEKIESEKKEKIDTQENESKRKVFKQKLDDENQTDLKKKEKKHKYWFDDWLPKIDAKPFDVLGSYTTLKFLFTYPMNASLSAKETSQLSSNTTTLNLFTGNAKYYLMPGVSMAVGNDKFKYWRYDLELSYLPVLATNTGDTKASNDVPNYTFILNKKDLSFHLLTIVFNNYGQYAFFDGQIVGYIGLGIGVGYAWSMGNTLSSDFVLPLFTGSIGISFMVGQKSKINIGYSFMYSKITLPNNYSFNRKNAYGINASNKAIQSGSLSFGDFLINCLSLEYQFYTS